MSGIKFFITSTILILNLFFIGFGFFCYDIMKMTPTFPIPHTADGIVVLTGGPGRLYAGLDLLKQGKGSRLLVSGVNPEVKPEEILPSLDLPVDLGYDARNTLQNAQEARAWAQRHGYKNLIIVTSRYHMRRSLLEFSQRLLGVKLLPYPVPASFKEPEELLVKQAWSEYKKYILALGRACVRSVALQLGLV